MNNGGVDKKYLEQLEQSVQKEISKYEFEEDFGFDSLFAWNKLETGRMEAIIVVLDYVRRVGGTYALLKGKRRNDLDSKEANIKYDCVCRGSGI